MITFQNVTKHYDNGSVVVDGLNFGSAGWQNYGICRPARLWKNSTSLRMINRLVEPSSGWICLTAKPPSKWISCNCAAIGYVIQNAGLFPIKHYR